MNILTIIKTEIVFSINEYVEIAEYKLSDWTDSKLYM